MSSFTPGPVGTPPSPPPLQIPGGGFPLKKDGLTLDVADGRRLIESTVTGSGVTAFEVNAHPGDIGALRVNSTSGAYANLYLTPNPNTGFIVSVQDTPLPAYPQVNTFQIYDKVYHNSPLSLYGGAGAASNAVFTGQISTPGVRVKEGANARMGIVTLVAGTKVVANTSITAATRIILSRSVNGGIPGTPSYTLNPGVGFTINSSSNADTSTFVFLLVEAI